MFGGCFTTFTGNWTLIPVIDKLIQTEVEEELEKQATEAIDAKIPFIWLYWPYAEYGQGDKIVNVLRDVESRLKRKVSVKGLARLGVAPTHVEHYRKAQSAILYIRAIR